MRQVIVLDLKRQKITVEMFFYETKKQNVIERAEAIESKAAGRVDSSRHKSGLKYRAVLKLIKTRRTDTKVAISSSLCRKFAFSF